MKLSDWLTPAELTKAIDLIEKDEDIFDVDHQLWERIFEFYAFEVNEIPYGTQKARDGDPAEWIAKRLEQEFK